MSVSCKCCVLSGRGRGPTDCGVSVCDREAWTVMTSWPTRDCQAAMIYVKLQSSSGFFLCLTTDRISLCCVVPEVKLDNLSVAQFF
jgi:hypothetical protein